jgi:hypothetical protein
LAVEAVDHAQRVDRARDQASHFRRGARPPAVAAMVEILE